MGFYVHFNAPTWNFKTGFGGRVIPTRRSVVPQAASAVAPLEPVLPHALHDADGEAIRKQGELEKLEEKELTAMGAEDVRPSAQPNAEAASLVQQPAGSAEGSNVQEPSSGSGLQRADSSMGLCSLLHLRNLLLQHPAAPLTPRVPHSTRGHGPESSEREASKRPKIMDSKKQRIAQLRETMEAMIRTVKVGDEVLSALDNYETDLDLEEPMEDDYWGDEDYITLEGVPEDLWSNASLDHQPHQPEAWVDELADKVEIARLLNMKVLELSENYPGEVSGSLTTKFVYDWRIKEKDGPDGKMKMWMRRSRFVARE